MLKDKAFDALNTQLNEEAYSAYLYLSMATYLNGINMPGMSAWMDAQVAEELSHAKKFFAYIESRGHQVELLAINQPQHRWVSPLAAFEAALEHERHITSCIEKTMDVMEAEKDRASQIFLQWFLLEQVEEEETVSAIVERMKMLEGHPAGMLMLDKELGERQVAPAGAAGEA